jgi:hypothetical protein
MLVVSNNPKIMIRLLILTFILASFFSSVHSQTDDKKKSIDKESYYGHIIRQLQDSGRVENKIKEGKWIEYSLYSSPSNVVQTNLIIGDKKIPTSSVAETPFLYPIYYNFDIDRVAPIISFKTIVIRDTTTIYIKENLGNKFTKDFSDLAKTLKTSDLIIFSQIKIKMPDGAERILPPSEFIIE